MRVMRLGLVRHLGYCVRENSQVLLLDLVNARFKTKVGRDGDLGHFKRYLQKLARKFDVINSQATPPYREDLMAKILLFSHIFAPFFTLRA